MNLVQRVETWGDTHHPAWTDGLRIILGLILFIKGVYFINDTEYVMSLVGGANFRVMPIVLVHYVAFAHLMGGFLIMVGCLTRLAVLAQLPILVGAVFFVNISRGFTYMNSELWLSIMVLALLITFLVIGSGPFSLDASMKRNAR